MSVTVRPFPDVTAEGMYAELAPHEEAYVRPSLHTKMDCLVRYDTVNAL